MNFADHEDSRNKFKAWQIKSTQRKAIGFKGDLNVTRRLWEATKWAYRPSP